LNRLSAGAHKNDDPFGIRGADVIEQMVAAAHLFGEPVHHLLYDGRTGRIVRIDGLARLEENIRVLRRTAQHRTIRRQRAAAMGEHQLVVDHVAQIVFSQLFNFLYFMRGAETVEKMDKGNAGLERSGLGDEGEIVDFLQRVGG